MMNILSAILLVCLLLCGCAGLGDWSAPLVEDYAIWRLNGSHVVLVRERNGGSSGETMVDAYVYRVTWNEEFICVQRTEPPEPGKDLPIMPDVEYFVLRVSDGEVFGPCTAAEYQAQCRNLGVSNLPEWRYVQDLRP